MKKVLMVLTNHFTNDARVMKEAVSLSKNGYEVTVRCFYRPDLEKSEVIDNVKIERVLETGHRVKRRNIFQKIYFYCRFLHCFSKDSKKFSYIHCHDVMPLPISVFIKWKNLNTQKIIYDCHEYETEISQKKGSYQNKINKVIERFFIKFTDKVICVSESIAQEYQRLYGIEKPTLVLNCPIFEDIKNTRLLHKRFDLHEDALVFLYQGGFSKGRGIENMLQAFVELNNPLKPLILMGNGPLLPLVEEAMEQSKNIYYIPTVPNKELLSYTASADVGILNYQNTCLNHYYCSPNKFFEYTMAGIPLIANDLFEISRLINKYKNGFIVENETKESFLSTVNNIEKNEILMAQTNINKMKKIFSWEEQEKNLILLYESF